MKNVLDTHYNRLADDYDDFLYYSPQFVRTLTSKMIEKLDLSENDRLVDLGCGTGIFSIDILKQVALTHPIVGVDPYREMLSKIPADVPIQPVEVDGLVFSRQPAFDFNKVLIKETVHHISDRDELFANLHRRLPDGGILLLVHVPPDVNYPLFDKALERCRDWHADPEELCTQLRRAGFRVEQDAVDYLQAIPKEKYFRMVECCYMSALTSLDDADLCRGLEEMAETHKDANVLEFIDHFDYLTAVRA